MTPQERDRMPKAFADAPTDAEYAMEMISKRVARGETVVPNALQKKYRRRRDKVGSRVSLDKDIRPGSPTSMLSGRSGRPGIAAGLGALNSSLGLNAQQAGSSASIDSFFGRGTTDEPNPLPPNITIDTSTPDADSLSIMSNGTLDSTFAPSPEGNMNPQPEGEKQPLPLVEKLNWRRLRDKAYKKLVPAEMHGLLSPDKVGSNWGLGGEASVCLFYFSFWLFF